MTKKKHSETPLYIMYDGTHLMKSTNRKVHSCVNCSFCVPHEGSMEFLEVQAVANYSQTLAKST